MSNLCTSCLKHLFSICSDGIFKDSKISVEYSEYSGKWFISHKAADKSVTVTKTYGACGYSGYQILEAALNLSEPKVYKDKLDSTDGLCLNVPATQVVQQKANKITGTPLSNSVTELHTMMNISTLICKVIIICKL